MSSSNPFEILSSPTPRTIVKPSARLYEDVLELVLLCTADDQTTSSAVYLDDLANSTRQHWDKNLIEQALFERLRLEDPMSCCRNGKTSTKEQHLQEITEKRALIYLAGCYQRLIRQRDQFKEVFTDIQSLFIEHCKTALKLPDLYEGQDLSKQWFDLLIESVDNSSLRDLIDRIHNDLFSNSSSDDLDPFLTAVFRHVALAIQPLDYFSGDIMSYIGLFTHLAQWSRIVHVIFHFSNPKHFSRRILPNSPGAGRIFEDTLIGRFLAKSCLPSLPGQPFLFFDRPKTISERDVEIIAGTMWGVTDECFSFIDKIHVLCFSSRCELIKNVFRKCFMRLLKTLQFEMTC